MNERRPRSKRENGQGTIRLRKDGLWMFMIREQGEVLTVYSRNRSELEAKMNEKKSERSRERKYKRALAA